MAKNILRELKPEEYFYLHNGVVIKNIKQLPAALKEMDKDIFMYHHNPQTNDFANWIRYLSDDIEFVAKIEKCFTKDEMIKVIAREISYIKKVATAVKVAQKKKLKKPLLIKEEKVKVEEKAQITKPAKPKKKKPKKTPARKKPKKKIIKGKKEITKFEKDVLKKIKKIGKKEIISKDIKEFSKSIKGLSKKCSQYLKGGVKEYILGLLTGVLLGIIVGTFI